MSHHHHHHSHSHNHDIDRSTLRIYVISILLNLAFVAIETGIGIWSDSLGLVSDAGHNLSDVFSLILALVAFRLASTQNVGRFTYGYRKSSVLISLVNALILLVAVGLITYESIEKLIQPSEIAINGSAISWTAGIGILINGVTAWLLASGSKEDINRRGAFLHMLADTLVSVGVVISGIIITTTGWVAIDPIISLVIAGVIFMSTWHLLLESIRMSIDAAPMSIDMDELTSHLEAVEGVADIHHVHVWAISTTETSLTAHVMLEDIQRLEEVRTALREELKHHGIHHSTLEFETKLTQCQDQNCCFEAPRKTD